MKTKKLFVVEVPTSAAPVWSAGAAPKSKYPELRLTEEDLVPNAPELSVLENWIPTFNQQKIWWKWDINPSRGLEETSSIERKQKKMSVEEALKSNDLNKVKGARASARHR